MAEGAIPDNFTGSSSAPSSSPHGRWLLLPGKLPAQGVFLPSPLVPHPGFPSVINLMRKPSAYAARPILAFCPIILTPLP